MKTTVPDLDPIPGFAPGPDFAPGSVWLVGAGPGDPGLLTLLAFHALKNADHVVHDALVDPRVLALIRPGAVVESMGKRGGRASPSQSEITARLLELALTGKRILRLKGGDPFVFGRGAEEALALADAGVPFRVVPGVTAGVGGLAYAGIPATARDCNSSVAFVTGHGQDGEVPGGFDWDGLARGAQVLVFYMALRHLDKVVERLVAAGRRPDEPVAIVSRATTSAQVVMESTLESVVAALAAQPVEPPALLVVGGVVGLRRQLSWWTPN
ncbi:uroporphyrinogen-III C-methyltransferase [Magnetospirillum aberrantis]|uniref:uroporphyrinogen-III C-methyltransferase n=1 Tax=Magnetospirillum aberrantis SpK TaxID=908842 RepID=A0A7C9UXY4_9PROT|nr:uroporphyrinogen-III C-methyltransferase [Magnetospirillum aberrantis]NFV79495.1 uroporphyrinogen-III C-methyltransferase [Magnetospirillum aberrantis SpK]